MKHDANSNTIPDSASNITNPFKNASTFSLCRLFIAFSLAQRAGVEPALKVLETFF